MDAAERVVTARREIAAEPAVVFELVADPARHPEWDGMDNLAALVAGGRVTAVGDVFTMRLTHGGLRDNHVVAFTEDRLLAWRPSEQDREPPGHRWRWELEPLGAGRTAVTHTYDWSELTDETRLERARWTTSDRLAASLERLAALAEGR